MRGVREAEAEPGRQARLGFAAARLPDPYLERLSDFSGCAAPRARQPPRRGVAARCTRARAQREYKFDRHASCVHTPRVACAGRNPSGS